VLSKKCEANLTKAGLEHVGKLTARSSDAVRDGLRLPFDRL
jgi:hypothetical protein